MSEDQKKEEYRKITESYLKEHPGDFKNHSEGAKDSNTISTSSNFTGLNFNLQDFLSSLSRLELFAFISLCFNSLILNALITIVFIYYGDMLIKYFNLEVKYPRLAKFISFRRKLNSYALKYNLFLILFSVFSQMFASILIF